MHTQQCWLQTNLERCISFFSPSFKIVGLLVAYMLQGASTERIAPYAFHFKFIVERARSTFENDFLKVTTHTIFGVLDINCQLENVDL